MKQLKDYLHLYLGCEILDPVNRTTHIIDYEFMNDYYDEDEDEFLNNMQIILRPLSDMTEEEKKNSPKAKLDKWGSITLESMAEITNYLRSLKPTPIDCDGLIEAGLAIDKTSLK